MRCDWFQTKSVQSLEEEVFMMHGDVDLARDEAKKQVRPPCVVMVMVVVGWG